MENVKNVLTKIFNTNKKDTFVIYFEKLSISLWRRRLQIFSSLK